jgi:hypothetical protein
MFLRWILFTKYTTKCDFDVSRWNFEKRLQEDSLL